MRLIVIQLLLIDSLVLSMHSLKVNDIKCITLSKKVKTLDCFYDEKTVSFYLDYVVPLYDYKVRKKFLVNFTVNLLLNFKK